jgi:alanyl-tRNA synthetase
MMSYFCTERLYYRDTYSIRNQSPWRRRAPNVVALERSVAFPEGGGQLGDRGQLRQGERVVTFRDTQKMFGRSIFRPDFPVIQVEGEVQLHLDEPLLEDWDESRPVEVHLDAGHRAQLTRSHTAAHLVYLGILSLDAQAREAVRGCLIEPTGGRFDLRLDRLGEEQVERISAFASAWQEADYPIEIEALPGEPECRIWVCNGQRIPCGGTHLPRTGLVGALSVRRRSKGKNLERVYYSVSSPLPGEVLARYGEGKDQG